MTNVITAIPGAWTAVATWFIDTMELVPGIFFDAEKGLTFIGTLAIFGGGLSVIIGLIRVIRSWVKAR